MVTWLWIIGITSVVWPIIVTVYFVNDSFNVVEKQFAKFDKYEAAQSKLHAIESKNWEKKISDLRDIIESQDAFIAALWEKVYGHEFSEGGFVGERYVATTYDALNKAWGVRPPWTRETDQVTGEFNYLKRDEKFPWGEGGWLRKG